MLHARHARPRDTVTVVLLAILSLAVLSGLSVWIPVAAPLAHTYGRTSVTATRWVFGAGMAVGVLVTGPAADRYGRRPVLLAGLVALVTASVAAGAAPSWPVHVTARAAQGLAAASVPPVVLAWVAEALPAARRALGVTVIVTAMQAGTPVGQLLGQWVTAAAGWRATYLGLAGAYLLFAVALRRRLTDTRLTDRPGVERAEPAGLTARRLLGLLGVRPLWACWLLSGLLPGAAVAMYAGLQLHLADVPSAPGDLLMATRIAGLAGILAAPLLLWRALAGLSLRGQALVGVGVATAGLLGQVPTPGPLALVAGSMLVAAGLPVTMASLTSVTAQAAPTARASALAVQSTVIYLGVAAGGAAAGLVGYTALCVAAAGALAVGLLPLVLTVPASARVPASHGAWAARPRAGAVAVFSVAGAAGLVVLLGLGGQGGRGGCGLGSGCTGPAGVAQAGAGGTGRSATAGATSGVPGPSVPASSGITGTGGGRPGPATPSTSGIGIGSRTPPRGTPLAVPPTTSGSGTGTPPTTAAPPGSTRPPPPPTTRPPTTAEPSSTAPTSTEPPASTTTSTAPSTTLTPSSTAPPTSGTPRGDVP